MTDVLEALYGTADRASDLFYNSDWERICSRRSTTRSGRMESIRRMTKIVADADTANARTAIATAAMRTSYLPRQNATVAVKAILMSERQLFLISANKSRPSGQWPDDDYDVRESAPDGPVIGRIYKKTFSLGTPWFWSLMLFPAVPADREEEETREAAMAALKEQWILRRGWEHP